jgi:hypothetical protein
MYYAGFTFTEAQNLPIPLRIWFINRTIKELNRGSEDDEGGSNNRRASTEERALMNMQRARVPARLSRLT